MLKNEPLSRYSKVRSNALRTARYVSLGFLLLILLGSVLLSLPIASATGKGIAYIDALFTATTATCVTGLTTLPTYSAWSIFGQIVIMLLIQIGGLGVVAVVMTAAVASGAKISIRERAMLKQSFGLNSIGGIISFMLLVVRGTFIIEAVGALFYCISFVPKYGIKGIYISLFTAISAFCNAGIDILGENSLSAYVSDLNINVTTMFLIILGGLGFPVWKDIMETVKEAIREKQPFSRLLKRLSLHSKLVLSFTGILILLAALAMLILEWNGALKGLKISDRILAAFFESVTLRTAGFFTVDQGRLGNAMIMLSIPVMLIGGSPAGCAGGLKTTTVVMMLLAARAAVKEKGNIEVYGRRISKASVKDATTVMTMYFLGLITLTVIFLAIEKDISFSSGIFETASAVATVGLSRGITQGLHPGGKIVLIILMFLGRIGPITAIISLKASSNDDTRLIELPEEEVLIG